MSSEEERKDGSNFGESEVSADEKAPLLSKSGSKERNDANPSSSSSSSARLTRRHSLQKAKEDSRVLKRRDSWVSNFDELLELTDEEKKFSVEFEEFVPFELRTEREWVTCNESIYGHAIAVLLCNAEDLLVIEGQTWFVLSWTELQAGINVFMLGGVKGVILYYLWKDIPPLEETKFCREGTHNGVFYVSVVAVFLLSLMKAFWKIYESVQMLDSTHRFGYDRETGEAYVRPVKVKLYRYIPAALICAFEMVAWVVILIVGTYAMISDDSVVDTVVMTVSISFIAELDTMAMELFNRQFRSFAESNRFRTKRLKRSALVQDIEVVVTSLVLIGASNAIVYVLYYYCPQGFNWHNDWDDKW